MIFPQAGHIFLQLSIWELVKGSGSIPKAIMALLLVFSVLSWAVIFSKWTLLRGAQEANASFLRAFHKANALDAMALASEQFRAAPLVSVFDHGYTEVARQMKVGGAVHNKLSLERTLQLGMSAEVSKLETNMTVLATAASISPFIGLLGTVWGIIDAFQGLGAAGSASLRAVAPGISEALITTALGLFAAIPAAIAYNWFGQIIRQVGARMEDFSLEFMNLVEQTFED